MCLWKARNPQASRNCPHVEAYTARERSGKDIVRALIATMKKFGLALGLIIALTAAGHAEGTQVGMDRMTWRP